MAIDLTTDDVKILYCDRIDSSEETDANKSNE